MNTICFLATTPILLLLTASSVLGQDSDVLNANHAYTIRSGGVDGKRTGMLSITDGKLCFYTVAPKATTPSSDTPLVPKVPDFSFGFVRDGSFLRVFIYADMRDKSKELAAKHGWYLTGDYSATPPKVILTQEPTKYSHWTFITIPKKTHSDGYYAHIKNENDLKKNAWLTMEEKGVRYKARIEALQPILSFKEELEFYVEDLNEGP